MLCSLDGARRHRTYRVRGKQQLHRHDVNKISFFICVLLQIIIIMPQYKEMSLARLKCELRKRDAKVTGRKWELFQQAKTAESCTCHTYDGVCLTCLMLELYLKIACNV